MQPAPERLGRVDERDGGRRDLGRKPDDVSGTGAAPSTNTLSFNAGSNRANNVILGLTGGVFSVQNKQSSGTVNLIIDVNGYFQ